MNSRTKGKWYVKPSDDYLIAVKEGDSELIIAEVDRSLAEYDLNAEFICEAVNNYERLLTAARIMHFDLIKKGEIPLAEMVDMFGNKI